MNGIWSRGPHQQQCQLCITRNISKILGLLWSKQTLLPLW
jgi:hypothetical protein